MSVITMSVITRLQCS